MALDGGEVRGRTAADRVAVPPFLRWPEFVRVLDRVWRPGPPDWPNSNMALVGRAGSGKTTLAREVLKLRDHVCVFGTKASDPSLYEPLRKEQGFQIVDKWSPESTEQAKVIFRPPLSSPTPEGLERQRQAFRHALLQVFQTGGWTLYFDELRYLTETLRLRSEVDLLYLQGRSLGITIVAGTQRPVSVPINMFEQSRFLITFRITGADDRRTMAAYGGSLAPTVFEVAAILPPHEALFVDTELDLAARTRVR